ncbi:hypothetical protein BDK51DRAFT_30627 [Blyttiomyces helicus]|uniref:F-box domain-containing protein n=1 Tax=Blyttiomyces helicus TaxID=388810 RepID=A0A4P9WGH7_9FUNG|nr:hypothetical protein BDK51DRAFT_30627 [Blyttiomyces helicus]|eukprot:RKO91919.1 hypothetical protein BDK51DRAFT_30627 [Blyttiomyces helicus]
MSNVAPLLVAFPHLTHFALEFTILSDVVPLPEGKWVAIERIIAGLQHLSLPFQTDREGGANAVARMNNAIGARLTKGVLRQSWRGASALTSGAALTRLSIPGTHMHFHGPFLLRVLPEVTVLELGPASLSPDPHGTGILRELLNHQPLTFLKMFLPSPACDIQNFLTLLRLRGSCLSRLEIFDVFDGGTPDEIMTSLAHTTPNLEKVSLRGSYSSPDLEISFPMLDNLKANCVKLTDVYPVPWSPGLFPKGIYAGYVWPGKPLMPFSGFVVCA